MTQYLDLFLQEAEEQLQILEQETLLLEKEPTSERMSSIFRAAHTLKGSSRAMGFSNFAGLTHEMENVLDALRGGSLTISTEVANVLLRSIDALQTIKEVVANGDGDSGDVADLVNELQKHLQGAPLEAPPKLLRAIPNQLAELLRDALEARPVYRATITLRADCAMKFARAFMAIKIVEEHGSLLGAIPDQNSLEEEAFENDFELYFHSDSDCSELLSNFQRINEVESVHVEPFIDRIHSAELNQNSSPQTLEIAAQPVVEAASVNLEAPIGAIAPKKKPEASQTVRVEVQRLDELMNLVGELVIDRTRIAEIGNALSHRYESDETIDALSETVSHISRITADLQDQLMKARMLPIETVLNRFPRMVRDLAQKIGKEVTLNLSGGETELDRSVIEVIGDPLIHIVRNSVDHGIEKPEDRIKAGKSATGTVHISACHRENHIVIEIKDDGRGINIEAVKKKAVLNGLLTEEAASKLSDREAMQLIFSSGLSTAETVSEVSGRGVGMDIVRSNIVKLGGIIDVDSVVGEGTKISLRLPLTLAIIRGLLVRVSGIVYVLPLGSVVETLKIKTNEIQTVNRKKVVVIRETTTPLLDLRDIFPLPSETKRDHKGAIYVVVVGVAEQRAGLIVDSLIGEHEVVIKSLSRYCGDVPGISGATILGNGKVALIADVNGLLLKDKK